MNINNVYNWLLIKLSRIGNRSCFLCEAILPDNNHGLCQACKEDFPLNHHACARCGTELPQTLYTPKQRLTRANAPYICGECLHRPPGWHSLTALCQYEYPATTMIQALKYQAKFANAKLLSSLLVTELKRQPQDQLPQCILPVPLHPERQKQRGFNQAIELARPIAKALNIPLDINSCVRTTNTPSQAGLDKLMRLQNLIDAFSLKKIPPYKHVALFDDVVTTGNTVRCLCKLLHDAGIERVDVWCIARASKQT